MAIADTSDLKISLVLVFLKQTSIGFKKRAKNLTICKTNWLSYITTAPQLKMSFATKVEKPQYGYSESYLLFLSHELCYSLNVKSIFCAA